MDSEEKLKIIKEAVELKLWKATAQEIEAATTIWIDEEFERLTKQVLKVCLTCHFYTKDLDQSRCEQCKRVLVEQTLTVCPLCGRAGSGQLIKCIGCYQWDLLFFGCSGCMNNEGPRRHHMRCPHAKRGIDG